MKSVWKDKDHNAKPTKVHEGKKVIDRCPNCKGTGYEKMFIDPLTSDFYLCKKCQGTGSKL